MKRALFAFFGVVMLTGCAYDYYNGDVRYTQDGKDCIFYSEESGRHYSEDIRSLDLDKKIVYRNTKCRDLYMRDNFDSVQRTERQVLIPATTHSDCGCAKRCSKRTYVYVK